MQRVFFMYYPVLTIGPNCFKRTLHPFGFIVGGQQEFPGPRSNEICWLMFQLLECEVVGLEETRRLPCLKSFSKLELLLEAFVTAQLFEWCCDRIYFAIQDFIEVVRLRRVEDRVHFIAIQRVLSAPRYRQVPNRAQQTI